MSDLKEWEKVPLKDQYTMVYKPNKSPVLEYVNKAGQRRAVTKLQFETALRAMYAPYEKI